MKTVFCRKYQKDLPKMDRAPFPGEKGEEIFSSVSKSLDGMASTTDNACE